MARDGDKASTSYGGSDRKERGGWFGKKKKKQQPQRDERPRITQAEFEAMDEETQEDLMLLASHSLLSKEYVKAGKQPVSLWDVGVALELAKVSEETGLGRSTIENARAALERRPGWMLRQGADKMQLRPREEAKLGLELLGRGHKIHANPFSDVPVLQNVSALAPQRDFAYGLFCKTRKLRRLFGARYAKCPPEELLNREAFYQDIILHAPTLELTSMIVVARDLPLESLQTEFRENVGECLANLHLEGTDNSGDRAFVRYPVSKRDVAEYKRMARIFSPASLSRYPITTKDGKKVLENTTFFISTTPLGAISVEVQSPGTLREQQPYLLGEFKSQPLTYAVFDLFIGRNAIDKVARVDIGACVLFFANGFKMQRPKARPALKNNKEAKLQRSVRLFKLPWVGRAVNSTMLVQGIQKQAARVEAKQQAQLATQ